MNFMNIQALYGVEKLHAGQILDQNGMDWASMAQSIQSLRDAVSSKGGTIHNSLALVCKREMYDMLLKHRPGLRSITASDSISALVLPNTVLCIVVDDDRFPNHYIILTDMEQWHRFIGANELPHRALIAIKGFKPSKKHLGVGFAGRCPNERAFLSIVEEHEFDGGVHNPLINVTVHSDCMMMELVAQKMVHNHRLLGTVPVQTDYDKERVRQIDLYFQSGLIITLMKTSDSLIETK